MARKHYEYPAWRYHPGGGAVVVADEAADKALGEGWGRDPQPVHRGQRSAVDVTEARDLYRRATQHGIKVDRRWNLRRLREEVEKAAE